MPKAAAHRQAQQPASGNAAPAETGVAGTAIDECGRGNGDAGASWCRVSAVAGGAAKKGGCVHAEAADERSMKDSEQELLGGGHDYCAVRDVAAAAQQPHADVEARGTMTPN